MIPRTIDPKGLASRAAGAGEALLGTGDTQQARDKYAEAGRLLERSLNAAPPVDKHLIRFLAATQHYKGGNYIKALELSKPISQRLLPSAVRSLFPSFLRDVKARTANDYAKRVKTRLRRLQAQEDYSQVLKELQEHPYVFPPGEMAFLRGVACEHLGELQTAALFYADAVRLNLHRPPSLVQGTLKRDGTLELNQRVDLPPGPVAVTVQALPPHSPVHIDPRFTSTS